MPTQGSILEKARALKQQREQEAQQQRTSAAPDDARAYAAMLSKPHPVLTLQLHRPGLVHVLEYSHLIESLFDVGGDTEATLSFQHLVIVITGQNLSQLIDPLAEHKLARLTEFDPERHDEPDPGALVVRHIGIQNAGETVTEEEFPPDFAERPTH